MGDENNVKEDGDLSITLKLIFTGFYIIIFFVGMFGNILVCIVVIKHLLKSVTNVFLCNLSCADILNILLVIPSTAIVDIWIGYWPFGDIMCKILPFLQCLTIVVTSFTYVVISTDRFFGVFFPLRKKLSLKKSKGILLGIWTISATLGIPLLIVLKVDKKPPICSETWTKRDSTVYSLVLLITQYFIPLFFLLSTYSAIAARVWLHKAPGERDVNRDRKQTISKIKMTKMMIIVSLTYAISQLPRHIVWLQLLSSTEFQWGNIVWNVVVLLQFSSTCYNPIIYCWMNHVYHDKFIYYICVVTKIGRYQQSQSNKYRMPLNTEFSSVVTSKYVKQNPHMDNSKFGDSLKKKEDEIELDNTFICPENKKQSTVYFNINSKNI